MAESFADPAAILGYHAHLYYDPQTRPIAERLRAAIGDRFPRARIGSWHDEPVGPHPVSMYQVAFAVEDFPLIVPWLMLNREALDVLVHPQTGEQRRRSHAVRAVARLATATARRCAAPGPAHGVSKRG